jgi:multidrug efflux pump subunit AcrA (membrane-fusion protein)
MKKAGRARSMSALQFDPAQEKATLYAAIAALEQQWGKPGMEQTVSALRAAVGRAEQALSILELEPNKAPVFVIQVLGLGFLVMYAQGALERAEQCVLDPLGRGRRREGPPRTTVDTVLPAGTIFCCPACGAGLSTTMTALTVQDIVLDEGTLLVPLTPTRPLREGWAPLACPFCGAQLVKDGKIHTSHQGWA